MFNVDACYKIIFDALLEEDVLENIALEVCNYTRASVFFILMSGEMPAYARRMGNKDNVVQRGYLTLEAYDRNKADRIKIEEQLYQETEGYSVTSDIRKNGRRIGSIVLWFEDFSRADDFRKISVMLSNALDIYYKDKEIEIYENISMRKQICARTLFEGMSDEIATLREELPANYMIVLVPCDVMERNKLFQAIQAFWNNCYFRFEEKFLCIVLCGINETNKETVLNHLGRLEIACCTSEMFENLEMCRDKREILERMDMLHKYEMCEGVMQEKDWYVQAIYTYTKPIICEAGLNDYFIQALIEKDKEKNTELYHTFRMYLLCENNISETAARLHIHRNTLIYRLKQIQKYIKRDINDIKVSRELLAFIMMRDASDRSLRNEINTGFTGNF